MYMTLTRVTGCEIVTRTVLCMSLICLHSSVLIRGSALRFADLSRHCKTLQDMLKSTYFNVLLGYGTRDIV